MRSTHLHPQTSMAQHAGYLYNSTLEFSLDSDYPRGWLDGFTVISHGLSTSRLPSSVGESALLLSNPLVTGGGDRFACRWVCVSHSSSWCTNVGCWHVLLVCGIDGRLCAQLAAAVWGAAAADWCCGVVTLPLGRLWWSAPHDCEKARQILLLQTLRKFSIGSSPLPSF